MFVALHWKLVVVLYCRRRLGRFELVLDIDRVLLSDIFFESHARLSIAICARP